MTRDNERDDEAVRELLANASTEPDQLLPVLHQVQARIGYVSKDAIRLVAQSFNLTRADVYGVVSFYEDFREAPQGEHVVQLCQAEACQAVGCRELASHAEESLGLQLGQTTPDGHVQIEAAYCFGNCALGPTIRIGDRIHGNVTPQRFDALMTSLRTRKAARR